MLNRACPDYEPTSKRAYQAPKLVSRGDIRTLTKGGGTAPLDVQGTSLGGGAPS